LALEELCGNWIECAIFSVGKFCVKFGPKEILGLKIFALILDQKKFRNEIF
jgi:hypothetical protein